MRAVPAFNQFFARASTIIWRSCNLSGNGLFYLKFEQMRRGNEVFARQA